MKNISLTQENSLASLYPDLSMEWHPTNNGELTPFDVTSNSHRKVWWKCPKGHEWETSVSTRSRGSGCPYCSNRIITKENCLATLYPELVIEWHPTKNGDITPFNVAPKAKRKVWWKCANEHEWQAAIYSRSAGSGCPYCPTRKKQ